MKILNQIISKWVAPKNKIKDSMILGLFGGFIGTIAYDISNVLLWRKGKTENLSGHLAGSMMMLAIRTNQRKNFILGEIFHLITGSALGLVQVEILKKYGKDHYLVKGGFTGLFTWGVLYNFGQRMKFFSRRTHLTKTKYASLWHHLLYGLVSSQAIVTLADPSIFKKNREKEHVSAVSARYDNPTDPWFDSPVLNEVTEVNNH